MKDGRDSQIICRFATKELLTEFKNLSFNGKTKNNANL
jgi:hypothetical protein